MKSTLDNPLFSPEKKNALYCLICTKEINRRKRGEYADLGDKGWTKFKESAEEWKDIAIPVGDEFHSYTLVHEKVSSSIKAFGSVHKVCRLQLGTKAQAKLNLFGNNLAHHSTSDDLVQEESNVTGDEQLVRRNSRSSIDKFDKKLCFICFISKPEDSLSYNDGGLARCAEDSSAQKILSQTERYLGDKSHNHFSAATRLNILLSGESHDIFSADVSYHRRCYMSYALPYTCSGKPLVDRQKQLVFDTFYYKLRKSVVEKRCAFLLHELLSDLQAISDEIGLEEVPINNTRTLRRRISAEFPNEISFHAYVSKYTLVYASDTLPCDYAVATLEGCGLRDEDLVTAFGKMIKRKIDVKRETQAKPPLTPKEMFDLLDSGPLPELYNVIHASIRGSGKINRFGYRETDSASLGTKIWALASDWEYAVTNVPTGKSAALGLVLHRLTGSKEGINYLRKCGHTVPYHDIRMQNIAWSRMISRTSEINNLRKGVVTHLTVDNNDGAQETISGSNTTHDTNWTAFQLPTEEELQLPTIGDLDKNPLDLSILPEVDKKELRPYYLGKRVNPPLFSSYTDDVNRKELELCLKKDIAWSVAGAFSEEGKDPFGSWTAFNRQVTEHVPIKCVQEYMPVNPHPPEYPVCKQFLDDAIQLLDDLDVPYLVIHSDECIYSKLCHILWKHPTVYTNLIFLMGGFHQIRVMQKILYKRYYSREIGPLLVDAETIAKGSSEQAMEGRHYYRCLRVHKELFDALVQLRFEKISRSTEMDDDLLRSLKKLRDTPNPTTLNALLNVKSYNELVRAITKFEDQTEGHYTVSYLKDVSLILALVSAVREGNFLRHLAAERSMIPLTFAFDHQNYARYLSYQHVYLNDLKNKNENAYKDFLQRGFGASISGAKFSSVHGDLITEYFNKATKGTAGPFRSGFSTNPDMVNNWIRTIHIHSKLKEYFRELLCIKTSSKHKELTPGGKLLHEKHVKQIKSKVVDYGIDPFSSDKPKSFATGVQISSSIVTDMLKADTLGDKKFLNFVDTCLVKGTKSFFDPISKNKLCTGIVKKKKKQNAVEVIKEDKQAFGLLVAKSVTKEEAFMFPITSLPLSLATPENELKQSDKASLTSMLIEESVASSNDVPKKAAWFVDGMAVVRKVKPKSNYKEFHDAMISFVTPPVTSEPTFVGIINDQYLPKSPKEGTRRGRGEKGPDVKIEGIYQHMLSGMRWLEFLHNGTNKSELISSFCRYLHTDAARTRLPCPFIINDKEKTYKISEHGSTFLFNCNHEEADYRLIFHALLCKQDSVIVANDADVFMLMVWAYHKFGVMKKWYMKYNSESYADISAVCRYLGNDICENLLSFHAITGCDCTSYMHGVGKIRVMRKLLKDPHLANLLKPLENDDPLMKDEIDSVMKFVQTVMYGGKANETYLMTRIRLYENQNEKTSLTLPPDPDSLLQALRRAQLQNYIWKRLDQAYIEPVDPEKYAWRWNETLQLLVPLWYEGEQLPPSLRRSPKKRGRKRTVDKVDGEADVAADVDTDTQSEVEPLRRRKSARKSGALRRQVSVTHEVQSFPASTVSTTLPPMPSVSSSTNQETGLPTDHDDTSPGLIEQSDQKLSESEWEVSDFSSSNDSSNDDWLP